MKTLEQIQESALKVDFNKVQQAHFDRLMSELEEISGGLGFSELKVKAEKGSKEALQVMRDYIAKKEQIVKFIETKEKPEGEWKLQSEPVFETKEGSIEACDISPDGKNLVMLNDEPPYVFILDLLDKNKKVESPVSHYLPKSTPAGVKFALDGKSVLISDRSTQIHRVWMPGSEDDSSWVQRENVLMHRDMFDCFTSPNGNDLLFIGGGQVELVKLDTIYDENREKMGINLKHEDPDRAEGYIQAGVCFSPDGKIAYVALNEKICRIKLNDDKRPIGLPTWASEETDFVTQFDPIYSIAIAPDGKYVFSGTQDGHISRWETETDKETYLTVISENEEDLNPPNVAVQKMIVSPDNKYLIAGDDMGRVIFIDVETGVHVREIQLPQASSVIELKLVGDDTIYAQTENMVHRIKST